MSTQQRILAPYHLTPLQLRMALILWAINGRECALEFAEKVTT